jgi:predicted transcriptional regulator of viral defense system
MKATPQKPDWDKLFEIAGAQEGYFTTEQAAKSGYSSQLLFKHIQAGRIVRVQRGIYRIVHFPAGEYDELVIAWLWSKQTGVISHQTALALHGLSDVLPQHVHLTLPSSWKHRRFRIPQGIVIHHSDVPKKERTWYGSTPTTIPRRTLNDCAQEGLSPELLRQAALQAIKRGLVTRANLRDVKLALKPFGGIGK